MRAMLVALGLLSLLHPRTAPAQTSVTIRSELGPAAGAEIFVLRGGEETYFGRANRVGAVMLPDSLAGARIRIQFGTTQEFVVPPVRSELFIYLKPRPWSNSHSSASSRLIPRGDLSLEVDGTAWKPGSPIEEGARVNVVVRWPTPCYSSFTPHVISTWGGHTIWISGLDHGPACQREISEVVRIPLVLGSGPHTLTYAGPDGATSLQLEVR